VSITKPDCACTDEAVCLLHYAESSPRDKLTAALRAGVDSMSIGGSGQHGPAGRPKRKAS
jgi:hypothetical protein